MLDYGIYFEFIPMDDYQNQTIINLSQVELNKTMQLLLLLTQAFGDIKLAIQFDLLQLIHIK